MADITITLRISLNRLKPPRQTWFISSLRSLVTAAQKADRAKQAVNHTSHPLSPKRTISIQAAHKRTT